eukprot:jgi/Undpi1/8759/HiC_scaffold_25.g11221.m1
MEEASPPYKNRVAGLRLALELVEGARATRDCWLVVSTCNYYYKAAKPCGPAPRASLPTLHPVSGAESLGSTAETGARGGEKGEQDNINCNSAEGGKESHNGGGGGSSSSSSNGSDNGSSVGGSSANGGKGDGGGSSGGGKYTAGPSGSAGNPGGGDGSGASALERQFAKPAAPRNGGLSEGLGKGTPSPSQRLRLQQENLEMRWRMAKKRDKTVCCRQCAGEGVVECRFCAGTGLFKIGSDLIVHPTSGRPPPCPVCKSKGEEVCTRCKGAGRIAAWLLRSERSGDLSGDRG